MKYLILNADDFGWDQDTFEATVNLFEKSLLSSATIMTGMPYTRQAIEYALKKQDLFSFGLHFNLVDGHVPEVNREKNSLCDEPGKFRESNAQRKRALKFSLNSDHIREEFEAQLKILLDSGLKVSHIDSHGHLHKFPQILNAILPVMARYGIYRVRRTQNICKKRSRVGKLLNAYCNAFVPSKYSTDHLYLLESHDEKQWFKEFIRNLPEGLTELGIHPGTADHWRQVETAPFLKKKILKLFFDQEIQLVNFRHIHV